MNFMRQDEPELTKYLEKVNKKKEFKFNTVVKN